MEYPERDLLQGGQSALAPAEGGQLRYELSRDRLLQGPRRASSLDEHGADVRRAGQRLDPPRRSRPQLGRIEARTGLRMMPTFPRSPRSFRTAGFPQYGWKAGLS